MSENPHVYPFKRKDEEIIPPKGLTDILLNHTEAMKPKNLNPAPGKVKVSSSAKANAKVAAPAPAVAAAAVPSKMQAFCRALHIRKYCC